MFTLTDKTLKEILLTENLMAEDKLAEAQLIADSIDRTLYQVIVDRHMVDDDKIGQIIASKYNVPLAKIDTQELTDNLLRIVSERVAKNKRCIAFERIDNKIKLAMENPEDALVVNLIKQKTGCEVEIYYVTPHKLNLALQTYKTDIKRAFADLGEDIKTQNGQQESDSNAPISQLVDILFDHAFVQKASDIHLEPQETTGLIRYRVDGILNDILECPRIIHERMISRLKVLAKLRTDEHLAAQDGKVRARINGEMIDLRLSILPLTDGEKAVLRILSTHGRPLTLEDLGMRQQDLVRVKKGYEKPYGMVLTTGPTGSGKSTSIYAILRVLNTREKNITTIEDPVEYKIKGLNQINVNTKAGLTFASGLRSILRQDPNIVSVGEIRDNETAGIAVNAALTGHLVLSTLHTNDAATSMVRLTDMKVEPFLVASTVNVIIAQRLVRKICDNCRVEKKVTRQELVNFFGEVYVNRNTKAESVSVFVGGGCKVCGGTGYISRIGLFETLVVTPKIRELTIAKASADDISKAAQLEGMTLMVEDGLIKVLSGQTSLDEVLRVTKISE